MSSKKHMDYDDLLLLYKFISLNYTERKITQLLKKDRSTIYWIIISNSRIENERTYSIRFKNCEHLLKCKKDGINNCPVSCPNFKKWLCPNLKKFPYNCNFCEIRYSCRKKDFLILRKHIFLEWNGSVNLKNFQKSHIRNFLILKRLFHHLLKKDYQLNLLCHI